MVEYINKSVLVAEIERRISQLENKYKELSNFEVWTTAKEIKCKINGLKEALSIINTLEVKEVDLEEALSDLDKDIKEFVATEEFERESTTAGHYWVIAKHAFLLGLKTQKGK